MPRTLLLATLLLAPVAATAQWQILDSHTAADLRGIDNVGGGVAWASGSNGTVLRSEDAGFEWQPCAIPPNAEHLDFRGIQAFDANTAIVMSSGKGDLSRLYKTTDGCQTWKLVFTNPDPDGFWDAVQFINKEQGFILGDPVLGPPGSRPHVFLAETTDGGLRWKNWHDTPNTLVLAGAPAIFAASNSSMIAHRSYVIFVTGGNHAGIVTISSLLPGSGISRGICDCGPPPTPDEQSNYGQIVEPVPLALGDSAGAFSIAAGDGGLMLVGGDYQKPRETYGTAVFLRGPQMFLDIPTTPPHGYRSAVAYDPTHKLWITVGPNGTDISTDDGRNWRALHPNPALHDPPDADQHWNALSLPFVVGPHGRIGLLEPSSLPPASH
jgi:hypothetical protein